MTDKAIPAGERSVSTRFILAFNRIEQELARIANEGSGASRPTFGALLAVAVKRNSGARAFDKDLKEYAELRNAIVHDGSGLPLAEPHPWVVDRLEYIYQQLSSPPRLVSKYTTVDICGPADAISQVARRMREGRYSQMPVFDGKAILGLITSETIARWIAYQLERDELVMSEDVTRVMEHEEDPNNWDVLGSQATIYDAKDRFDRALRERKFIDAIVVTVSGDKKAPPVGIITIFDYPDLAGQHDGAIGPWRL